MSRYIDVEAFMQNAEPVLTWEVIAALNREPAADVVEPVRCKLPQIITRK